MKVRRINIASFRTCCTLHNFAWPPPLAFIIWFPVVGQPFIHVIDIDAPHIWLSLCWWGCPMVLDTPHSVLCITASTCWLATLWLSETPVRGKRTCSFFQTESDATSTGLKTASSSLGPMHMVEITLLSTKLCSVWPAVCQRNKFHLTILFLANVLVTSSVRRFCLDGFLSFERCIFLKEFLISTTYLPVPLFSSLAFLSVQL